MSKTPSLWGHVSFPLGKLLQDTVPQEMPGLLKALARAGLLERGKEVHFSSLALYHSKWISISKNTWGHWSQST